MNSLSGQMILNVVKVGNESIMKYCHSIIAVKMRMSIYVCNWSMSGFPRMKDSNFGFNLCHRLHVGLFQLIIRVHRPLVSKIIKRCRVHGHGYSFGG